MEEHLIKLELLKSEFKTTEHLFKEKVTAQLEYLQIKNKYETALVQKELFIKSLVNKWQSEVSRLEIENEKLSSEIKQLNEELKLYAITAPTSGTLYQTIGVQVGSFITAGQIIVQISPDDEIIAECYVSPSDIGYLKENQKVNFQIDAFNYNQWGLLKGKVLSISEDIVNIENNPVFKIRCSLSNNFLQMKSGHKGSIKKGMTLTGRFHLTNRTLFQLLYDKMDDWLNPKTT